MLMSASQIKEIAVNKLEFMLAKTQFEIARVKYLNQQYAIVQFLSYKNYNYEHEWETKLKELGYTVKLLGSDEKGILSYKVSWE